MLDLVPWNTRSSHLFNNLRKEMDQLLERFTEGEQTGEVSRFFAPQANLAETEKQYELTLDLPGMKPDEVNVEFRDGELWVSGERKAEKEEKGKTFHRVERSFGQFRRVVRLPGEVDPEKVSAQYTDGVLQITVPKAEAATPKRIKVKG